jgi:hypothetical protein
VTLCSHNPASLTLSFFLPSSNFCRSPFLNAASPPPLAADGPHNATLVSLVLNMPSSLFNFTILDLFLFWTSTQQNINTTPVTRFFFVFDLLLFCILLKLWFSVFNLTTHIRAICFFNVLQLFDKMLVWNNSFFRYWCSSKVQIN